jgi:hypothetical protein
MVCYSIACLVRWHAAADVSIFDELTEDYLDAWCDVLQMYLFDYEDGPRKHSSL